MPETIVEQILSYIRQHPVSEIITYLCNGNLLNAAATMIVFYLATCFVIIGAPKYLRIVWILLKKLYYQESKVYTILYLFVGSFYILFWFNSWHQMKDVFVNDTARFNDVSLAVIILMFVTRFRSVVFLVPKIIYSMMMDIGWRLDEIEADS